MKQTNDLRRAVVVSIERSPKHDYITNIGNKLYGFIITFDNGDKGIYATFDEDQENFNVGWIQNYLITTIISSKGYTVHRIEYALNQQAF